jgi:hypothetical protein
MYIHLCVQLLLATNLALFKVFLPGLNGFMDNERKAHSKHSFY